MANPLANIYSQYASSVAFAAQDFAAGDVIIVAINANGSITPTCTSPNLTFTTIAEDLNSRTWYAVVNSALTSEVVTVNFGSSPKVNCQMWSESGVNTTTPFLQLINGSHQGAGGHPQPRNETITLAALGGANPTGFKISVQEGGELTFVTSHTTIYDPAALEYNTHVYSRSNPTGATTCTYSLPGKWNWGIYVAYEVNPDGGGGGTTHDLVVADNSCSTTNDVISLQRITTLVTSDNNVTTTSDVITLSVGTTLEVTDNSVSVTSDIVSLTALHALTVIDNSVAVTNDGISLSALLNVTVIDNSAMTTNDQLFVTKTTNLLVADNSVAVTNDVVDITTGIAIEVIDNSVVVTNETISVTSVVNLGVSDNVSTTTSDIVTISKTTNLIVIDNFVPVANDVVTLFTIGFDWPNTITISNTSAQYSIEQNSTIYGIINSSTAYGVTLNA